MSPTLHRLVTFNIVGVLGAIVHLATLSVWSRWLGLPAPLASLLAVEAALIHNFLWHERWTWRDRWPADGRMGRLLRFHGANGLVSVAGSGLLVPCLMHAGLAVEAAGIMAIVACSLVNFRLADRGVFTSAVAMLALCAGARPAGASPQPEHARRLAPVCVGFRGSPGRRDRAGWHPAARRAAAVAPRRDRRGPGARNPEP